MYVINFFPLFHYNQINIIYLYKDGDVTEIQSFIQNMILLSMKMGKDCDCSGSHHWKKCIMFFQNVEQSLKLFMLGSSRTMIKDKKYKQRDQPRLFNLYPYIHCLFHLY